LFYQLDNTRISANPFGRSTGVGILSTDVLATDLDKAVLASNNTDDPNNPGRGKFFASDVQPLPQSVVQGVTDLVKKELIHVGLLNDDGSVSETAQSKYGFDTHMALPTPGILVKGCLDDCDICEDDVHESIKLDLENKRLQNHLLKRQIELLDKSQEYRCCPSATAENE